ncbi:MAG: hypothetical protein M3Y20_07505 [Actinomycetota bacterium]|nr:hypothetical protein [Actinomycetota bacterium]
MTFRAVVVTPVQVPEALAAACALAGVKADVVPSEIGSLAVCVESEGDAPLKAGAAISQILKGVLVVVLRNTDGQIDSTGYTNGEPSEVQAAGLWLDAAPVVLEDLITGTIEPADADGVVSSVGMSRWRAARNLAKLARTGRKQAASG